MIKLLNNIKKEKFIEASKSIETVEEKIKKIARTEVLIIKLKGNYELNEDEEKELRQEMKKVGINGNIKSLSNDIALSRIEERNLILERRSKIQKKEALSFEITHSLSLTPKNFSEI